MRHFGLYIHWPFCAAKCPYCDFNSHVRASIDGQRWEKALRAELARVATETPNHILSSIFFGGGTPSLMDPELVANLISDAKRFWRSTNDLEITLEANPTSIEAGKFQAFRDGGVNRVSMGVQALNDQDLKKLGRLHSVDEALKGLEIAQTTFDRVSIDLIYARQDQSEIDWRSELSRALSLNLDHLSLYQLTIEHGTAFGDRYARGLLKGLPSEDRAIELWDITQEMTTAAGYEAYEVSNHAKPGSASRHNLVYWSGGDWAGIGPGAHGRLTIGDRKFATQTELHPETWLDMIETNGSGELERIQLSKLDQAEELLLMGLRLSTGVCLSKLAGLGWAPPETRIDELAELGLIQRNADSIRATTQGRPLLNAVLERLLT